MQTGLPNVMRIGNTFEECAYHEAGDLFSPGLPLRQQPASAATDRPTRQMAEDDSPQPRYGNKKEQAED